MLADLVSTQEQTIERQTEECQQAKHKLLAAEISLEEAQRKLKEAVEQKQKTAELNDMDLQNIKLNAERQAMERMQQASQLGQEKESL